MQMSEPPAPCWIAIVRHAGTAQRSGWSAQGCGRALRGDHFGSVAAEVTETSPYRRTAPVVGGSEPPARPSLVARWKVSGLGWPGCPEQIVHCVLSSLSRNNCRREARHNPHRLRRPRDQSRKRSGAPRWRPAEPERLNEQKLSWPESSGIRNCMHPASRLAGQEPVSDPSETNAHPP